MITTLLVVLVLGVAAGAFGLYAVQLFRRERTHRSAAVHARRRLATPSRGALR